MIVFCHFLPLGQMETAAQNHQIRLQIITFDFLKVLEVQKRGNMFGATLTQDVLGTFLIFLTAQYL